MSQQYSAYVGHWRNLSYLEAELDAIHADEAEAVAESDRRLQVSGKWARARGPSTAHRHGCPFRCAVTILLLFPHPPPFTYGRSSRPAPPISHCAQAMQRRLREEELKVLRGQAKVDERALDDAIDADATDTRVKRPAGASTRGRGVDGGGGLQGGMAPDEESESGDEEDDFGEEEEESAEGDSQVRERLRSPAKHAQRPGRNAQASAACHRA